MNRDLGVALTTIAGNCSTYLYARNRGTQWPSGRYAFYVPEDEPLKLYYRNPVFLTQSATKLILYSCSPCNKKYLIVQCRNSNTEKQFDSKGLDKPTTYLVKATGLIFVVSARKQ